MPKVKKFLKNHKREIVLVTIGAIIGSSIATRRHDGDMDELVHDINEFTSRTFAEHGGNFSNPSGGYKVPVWNRA